MAGAAATLFMLIGPPNILTISAAMVVTIGLCHVFNLMAGSRSALAAVIIIMLHSTELPAQPHLWAITLERILSVIAGCLIGLAVTFIFHQKLRYSPTDEKPQNEA